MEHIVQFAISMDDETIKKRIEENAERVITKNIENSIRSTMFKVDRYGYKQGLDYYVEQLFTNWLESHKDEIIELATDKLAKNMSRTKAVKNAIEGILKEGEVND